MGFGCIATLNFYDDYGACLGNEILNHIYMPDPDGYRQDKIYTFAPDEKFIGWKMTTLNMGKKGKRGYT